MASRRNDSVAVPAHGGGVAARDLPGTADAGTIDLPTPIIRPHVKPYSREFRHQAVLLTRSTNVPVTHVARDLGISIGTLRDWIAQARHDPPQLQEGVLPETAQAELVRLRKDNQQLLRDIAILRDALAIVASEATTNKRVRGDRPARHFGPGGSPHR
jgi:transposase